MEPREEENELMQPVEDDAGEKALSLDMPSVAQELTRQLSWHQKENEDGAQKIALNGRVVDQQDLR